MGRAILLMPPTFGLEDRLDVLQGAAGLRGGIPGHQRAQRGSMPSWPETKTSSLVLTAWE